MKLVRDATIQQCISTSDKITTAKNVGQSGIVGSSISLSPEQIHIIDTSASKVLK